jgi:hypothetical protein
LRGVKAPKREQEEKVAAQGVRSSLPFQLVRVHEVHPKNATDARSHGERSRAHAEHDVHLQQRVAGWARVRALGGRMEK